MEGTANYDKIGHLLALEIHQGKEINGLMELAAAHPSIDNQGSPTHWDELLEQIEEAINDESETREEFQTGLELYFKEDLEALNEWKKSNGIRAFSKFFKALDRQS